MRRRAWATPILALVLVACGADAALQGVLEPGSRQWIIPVHNGSAQPAVLAVARDGPTMGAIVGQSNPSSVPPGETVDVTFTLPPGDGWAIFVNPGPQLGPLILASDVPPDASGRLPLSIEVGPQGPSVSAPGERGWFGN